VTGNLELNAINPSVALRVPALKIRFLCPRETATRVERQRENVVGFESIDFQADELVERSKAGFHDAGSKSMANVNLTNVKRIGNKNLRGM